MPLYGLSEKPTDEKQPVLYYADSQTYDRDLGILILKGNVEFTYQENVLDADYVSYNENTDIVTASGNVRIRQADGDINFAEYAELTGDMKKGIVLQMRTLMEDNSKLAAREGRKYEDREELDQAVYTPCELCGDSPPTWQINASRAVKDEVTKDIYFTDATLRFLDIPFFYMPYSTQPLERRSGFLIPKPGHKTDFGQLIQIPYFIVFSKDADATLTPVLFTQQNPLLLGEYRQAFGNGIFRTDGSITQYKLTKKDKKAEKEQKFKLPEIRGHIYGEAKFDLNDTWRFRGDGGYVSDKTYFRKYSISGWKNESAFTSKGIVEGFLNQRDYAAASTYYFQGLRDTDKQKGIAAVLPMLEYSAYSQVDPLGGRFTFDGNLLNLTRQAGAKMQRGVGEVGWQRPVQAPLGQLFTVFGSLRGDLYGIEDFKRRPSHKKRSVKERRSTRDETTARFFPQSGIDWRWPFITTLQSQSVVLQPLAQIIAAPDQPFGGEMNRLPNEDSTDFEFNDANLFSPDRFPGYDVIDTGSRAVYGGQVLATGELFGDIELFMGQSYSLSDPKHPLTDGRHRGVEKGKGIKSRFSDYVGRVEVNPLSWLSLNYRFRLDKESFRERVSEIGGSLGPDIAKLSGNYTFISKRAGTPDNQNFKQISLTFTSQFTKYWSFTANIIHDLNVNSNLFDVSKRKKDKKDTEKKDEEGRLSQGVGLTYRDDCFALGVTVTRQFYKSRDLRPGTIFLVSLFLKNIGDFSYSFNPEKGIFGDSEKKKKENQ